MKHAAPRAGHFALITIAVVLATIYGSLVPFEYQARSWSKATQAFDWVLHNRTHLESKSDGIANVILGLPLGFFLLGAFRVDKPGYIAALVTALLLLPLCILFAAGVEFSQLWFPKRTCSTTDIEAQSMGSAVGMVIWLMTGQQSTRFVRGTWASSKYGGKVTRVLVAYLFLYLFIQVLPFDVMTSPKDIARRLRNQAGVTLVPFADWTATANHAQQRADQLTAWLKLLCMYGTIGALLGKWRSLSNAPYVVIGAITVASALELAQVPVLSRHASTTDAILGSLAVIIVWVHTVALAEFTRATRASLGFAVLMGTMALANWWPLYFDKEGPSRLNYWNAIPFAAIETQHYLFLLGQLVETVTLWAVAGAAVIQMKPGRTVRGAVFVVTLCAAVVELGQVWVPSRTPATTDIVLAMAGAYAGATVSRKVWTLETKETSNC